MATVAPAAAHTKFDARVEAEIGKAVGRIRANDLLVGGLAAATLVLAYTVGMVLLDRWLLLPMAARQAALGGFVVCLGVIGYLFMVRPLRRAVNPRYAARRVEETVADSKNAVINWVDLQDRDLPPTVRAAVGQRAAGQLQTADVARATESKPLVWLGAAAGLLVATLAVLFVVFKPAPFASLVKRTFNPFVAREVATRTTLTLTEPATGDTTVTAGESMTVAVDVAGSVPPADGPNRLRLQVWRTDAAAEVDELPLEPGPGNDWRLTVPPSVVQNGFQFRVVGGDSRTADYRVTVRSRPLVTGFEARYESPAYTRIPVEVGREPKLEGYRGTKVTLVARTNRPLKRGWMQLEGKPDPLPATVVGDNRDGLQVELTLAESGSYRLGFTSAADETSEPTPPYPIRVLTDQPPTLTITTPPLPAPPATKHDGDTPKPDPDTITLPANGTLAVDGEVADDFGLTAVTLRMQVVAPYKLTLQPKPYRGGKSFQRPDGSFPTRLADADGSQTGYKDTVDLAGLKDTTEKPLPFAPDTVIEYWLEATDNCAEPRPNVGTSAKKKLRLTPAVTDAAKKQELDQKAAGRKAEQQKHEQAQDKQLQGEQRPPKQLRPEDKSPQADPQQGQPQDGQPQEGGPGKPPEGGQPPKQGEQPPGKQPDSAKPPADQPPKADGKTGEQPPQPGSAETTPKGGKQGEPNGKPDKQPGATGEKGKSGAKSEPTPEQKKLDDQAAKVQEAIRGQGGDTPPETAPPPQPAGGGGQPSPADAAAAKEQERQKQQAIDDLASDDPGKKQAARDKLDQTVGKQERERIEKLQKDLDSDDPKVREQAKKELGELDRETGTSGAGVRNDRPEDVERLSRELNSQNSTTKKNAERRADRDFGQQGREQLQKAGDKLNSPDKQKQDEGKKDVDELMKKEKKKPKEPPADSGQPKGGDQSKAEQTRQQANDLNSTDPDKKQAAEKAMDQKMGEAARKDLQQKLGSDDPKQQEAGKQQVEQMAKQAGDAGRNPSPEQVKEMADAARDLNSTDPDKKQAAEQKLDKQMGEAGRKQLQQDTKDSQSDDPGKRDAAEQTIKDAADKMAGGGGEKQPADQPKKGPTKEQIDQAAETARDLTSSDAAKREAAEKKLDAQMGKAEREKLQKNLDDLKTGTPEQQAEAAKQLEQTAKDTAAKAGQKPPTPEQAKELADAAKNLNSPDPDKKKAAEQKVDEAVGKEAREKIQQEQAAKQPDPKAARDAAEKAMSGDKGPKADPAEVERKMKEVADAAKDLNSSDPDKKKAAEQKLDQQVGKEAREQMQQLQNDAQSSDPAKQEAAKKQIKEAMDKVRGKFDPKRPFQPGGGSGTDTGPGKRYDDDPANRLKTAELQLKTFEKNRDNKALLEKLGYTPEEYNRFVAEMEKRVNQLRQEATMPTTGPAGKAAAGPPTVRVGEGAGKVEKKDNGPTTGGAGGGKEAPGYADAQKRFAAQAAKGGKKPPAEAPKQP